MRINTQNRPRWISWVFIIGIATFATRTILDSDFRHSGMLYLGMPFLVAFLAYKFLPQFPQQRTSRRLLNGLINATIVMLATSAILFEGFLCVLMFLPIYWVTAILVFTIYIWQEKSEGKAKIGLQIAPLLILLFAFEGTVPALSLPRDQVVTRTILVNSDVAAIKANLAKPIQFVDDRNWFISIFPLPDKVQTGTLRQGDVHRLHFTYRRWFFTNEHKGEMHIRLSEVSDNKIRTQLIRNDSYLSHYMQIDGTEIDMKSAGPGQTRVTLSIHYTRLLDPAWYFGPMQKYAVTNSADYLLENVIAGHRNSV